MRIFFLFIPLFLFASVKDEIIKFYTSHYPTIKIINITSNRPFPKKYQLIDFKLVNYKMPSGTLKIDNKYYFFKIDAKIGVNVAIKIIKPNERILGNTIFKEVTFRNFYSHPVYNITPNLVASKVISINNIITRANTKIRSEIQKNETVTVIFNDANIEVYSKGTALNDANEGDFIRVKINGKIYEGKVKNKRVVIE